MLPPQGTPRAIPPTTPGIVSSAVGVLHLRTPARTGDDGIIQEAFGSFQGLLRDGTTPMGLPVVSWENVTVQQGADALQSHLHKPRGWF